MRLSPGSENCTEIGLRWACNGPVHSNGPSLALRMALTCAPGGTPLASLFHTCTLLHICTPPAKLLHRLAQYFSIAHRMAIGAKSEH